MILVARLTSQTVGVLVLCSKQLYICSLNRPESQTTTSRAMTTGGLAFPPCSHMPSVLRHLRTTSGQLSNNLETSTVCASVLHSLMQVLYCCQCIADKSEPNSVLQSVVATLSTGPVGPGDKINHSDVKLIMKSCNADGLLLKPSRPAFAIDAQIKQVGRGSFIQLQHSGQKVKDYFSSTGSIQGRLRTRG